MMTMAAPHYDDKIYFRVSSKAQLALDTVVAKLRSSGQLTFYGRKLSKEAIVQASWLWMDSLSLEELEQTLQPMVEELETYIKRKDAARSKANDEPLTAIDGAAQIEERKSKKGKSRKKG